jgi:hypothetical protein
VGRKGWAHLGCSEFVDGRVYKQWEAGREAGDVARVKTERRVPDVQVGGAGGRVEKLRFACHGRWVVQLAADPKRGVRTEGREWVGGGGKQALLGIPLSNLFRARARNWNRKINEEKTQNVFVSKTKNNYNFGINHKQ